MTGRREIDAALRARDEIREGKARDIARLQAMVAADDVPREATTAAVNAAVAVLSTRKTAAHAEAMRVNGDFRPWASKAPEDRG